MKTGINSPWKALVASARRAPLDRDDPVPPPGFVTRVLSRASSAPRSSALDLLGLRALVFAGALAVACAGLTLPGLLSGGDLEDPLADDPTIELMELL